jgi:hypothetical protein
MKVGVIGSGDVAQTLGAGFLKHGHEVMLGTRDAGKLKDFAAAQPAARIGGMDAAARFGDIVVLAVAGSAAKDALTIAGAGNIARKIVIDATNPIAGPPVNGILPLFTTHDRSLMETLQDAFPAARFVKAFSSVGARRMVNPQFAEGRPTMFICGADASAKSTVAGVLAQFGWETADMGGPASARAIEPLVMLWCAQGFLHNEWTHAFKVLH